MKIKLFCVLLLMVLSNIGLSQTNTSGLLERSQIVDKYKWDTKDIYESVHTWEEDFEWIEQNLTGYEQYSGKLSSSAQNLLECLQFDEKLKKKLGYVWLYAKLHRDVEMNNDEYQQMWSRYAVLKTKTDVASAFIQPEIISINEETIKRFTREESGLKIYDHYFNELAGKQNHTLSKNKEEELSKIAKLVDNPYGVFGSLVYSELPFPVIKNDKGEDIQLNRSTSWRARSSQDRTYRKRGYQGYYKSLSTYKGTLTKNLYGLIDGKIFLAESRNYRTALEASLDRYNIPTEIYENLIKSVRSNLQPFHRWMKMKKELLELDTLYIYDTRVSIFSKVQKEYSWEEARDLTIESLNILGSEYIAIIENAYKKRWIDAYPHIGKETGGYSSGPAGPHPYVKMNWGGQMLDLYTLVHELGHYVHATKSMEAQPYIYQDYPSFLSEVASTTAENIAQFYMIKQSESKDGKLYQIEQYLDNAIMMIYNSTMMAEFELSMYQKVENGEPLSAIDLSEMYGKLLSEYYGEKIYITEIDKYAWLEYPHYYLDYYLYSYATSFAASVQIASNIYTEGEPAVFSFSNLLEAGSSDYPVEVIKEAGVDLTTQRPYEAVNIMMNELMDEMEKTLSE